MGFPERVQISLVFVNCSAVEVLTDRSWIGDTSREMFGAECLCRFISFVTVMIVFFSQNSYVCC